MTKKKKQYGIKIEDGMIVFHGEDWNGADSHLFMPIKDFLKAVEEFLNKTEDK